MCSSDLEESDEATEKPDKPVVVAQAGNLADDDIGRTDDPVRMYLREMGSVELLSREGEIAIAKRIEAGRNTLRVRPAKQLRSVDITTMPHAGFPTDVQAQMMVLMLKSPGISIITERIFESRFMHVNELARMGADISIEGPSAIVKGGQPLSGADVMASDLRASAALVLAGMAAKGVTRVNRVYHIDRGYENIDGKLRALGANISREPGQ